MKLDTGIVEDYLTQSGMSEQEAAALGIEVGSGEAACPEDDCDGTLEKTDDCSMCDECFYSPC